MTKATASGSTASGIGFGGLLAIAFIVLKLLGKIDWAWVWVLGPLWIPVAFILGIMVVVLLAAGIIKVVQGL